MWMIDPIYKKFTAKAFQNLTSPEFYTFFTNMLKNGEQEFQFSNKHLDMQVDPRWVDIIEATIPPFQEIARDPRVIITQEELVTNVVQVRKINSQVIRHLLSHSYLIDAWDKETGDVRPAKMLNILKEETWDTYENRFVYTLLVKTYEFVKKRYFDMKELLGDDYGANLKIKADGMSRMEHFYIDSHMKIVQKDEFFDDDDPNSIFSRIKKLYWDLLDLMQTRFAKEMQKFSKVVPPLVPTNAIKKNPYLRKCHKLWDFIWSYYDVGYTIDIIEQNPEINQKFEQDIYDNIAFTYIILKGYLEFNRDRAMDRHTKARKTTIRPKYIKQIIEEFVDSFDLPDVEVRKILIEELTKEDLMREERDERYRIVEEKRKADLRKKQEAELERIRKLKEAERAAEKKYKEKEREKARRAKEKAKLEKQKAKEKAKAEARDQKNMPIYTKEINTALDNIAKRKGTYVKPAVKEKKKADGEV